MYYLQSRYYNPALGRFLNADAFVATGQGLLGNNTFVYCNNNSVICVDYSGTVPRIIPVAFGNDVTEEKNRNTKSQRDVTEEVMSALTKACRRARTMRSIINTLGLKNTAAEGIIYIEFYNLVNHSAPWDIKREKPWQETIGTPYPGYNAEVAFNGMTMTPEMLGNYSYGYLGHAYGIPLLILIAGSYYAANFPTGGDALSNEIWDWGYVAMGYRDAY